MRREVKTRSSRGRKKLVLKLIPLYIYFFFLFNLEPDVVDIYLCRPTILRVDYRRRYPRFSPHHFFQSLFFLVFNAVCVLFLSLPLSFFAVSSHPRGIFDEVLAKRAGVNPEVVSALSRQKPPLVGRLPVAIDKRASLFVLYWIYSDGNFVPKIVISVESFMELNAIFQLQI